MVSTVVLTAWVMLDKLVDGPHKLFNIRSFRYFSQETWVGVEIQVHFDHLVEAGQSCIKPSVSVEDFSRSKLRI